jgi:DNA-binding transcriptional ArsR family regulator
MAASSRTTARSRRPRTVRCDVQPVVQLAERDRWLLEALAKMRFLPTSDLARLLFGGSRSAANKRLRRLFDAGLVRVWLRSLSEENVYSLTRAGLNAVRSNEQVAAQIFSAKVPRGLDGKLDHLLAINRVRIALATTLPEAGGELTWWRSDWELCGHGGDRIAPDALFAVWWPDGREQAFSLEVDRRTRGVRRFLEKVLRYRSQAYRLAALHGVRKFIITHCGRRPALDGTLPHLGRGAAARGTGMVRDAAGSRLRRRLRNDLEVCWKRCTPFITGSRMPSLR